MQNAAAQFEDTPPQWLNYRFTDVQLPPGDCVIPGDLIRTSLAKDRMDQLQRLNADF